MTEFSPMPNGGGRGVMTAGAWNDLDVQAAAANIVGTDREPWPPEALNRLMDAIKDGLPCDDDQDEPVETPELDAIDELAAAISAVRTQLAHPIACMQLRRDDNLPATPEQRAAARTAVWQLRVAVARTLFALAFEGATSS